jgi:hypothetical protein
VNYIIQVKAFITICSSCLALAAVVMNSAGEPIHFRNTLPLDAMVRRQRRDLATNNNETASLLDFSRRQISTTEYAASLTLD